MFYSVVGFPLLIAPTSVHANPVTWTVGGSVSGEFTYDADINDYTAIDLHYQSQVYNDLIFGDGDANGFFSLSPGLWLLEMAFSAPLTNADGLIGCRYSRELLPSGGEVACLAVDNVNIFVFTESAQGIPEPPAFALLGVALAGLGFSRRCKLH